MTVVPRKSWPTQGCCAWRALDFGLDRTRHLVTKNTPQNQEITRIISTTDPTSTARSFPATRQLFCENRGSQVQRPQVLKAFAPLGKANFQHLRLPVNNIVERDKSSINKPLSINEMAALGEDLLGIVNKLQDLVFNTIGNDSLDLPQIVRQTPRSSEVSLTNSFSRSSLDHNPLANRQYSKTSLAEISYLEAAASLLEDLSSSSSLTSPLTTSPTNLTRLPQ